MNKIVSEINDLFETKLCCEELSRSGVIPGPNCVVKNFLERGVIPRPNCVVKNFIERGVIPRPNCVVKNFLERGVIPRPNCCEELSRTCCHS